MIIPFTKDRYLAFDNQGDQMTLFMVEPEKGADGRWFVENPSIDSFLLPDDVMNIFSAFIQPGQIKTLKGLDVDNS